MKKNRVFTKKVVWTIIFQKRKKFVIVTLDNLKFE